MILTLRAIAAELGISHVTMWRWAKKPGFPRTRGHVDIPNGTRTMKYDLNEVRQWMDERGPKAGRPLGSKLVEGKVIPPEGPR